MVATADAIFSSMALLSAVLKCTIVADAHVTERVCEYVVHTLFFASLADALLTALAVQTLWLCCLWTPLYTPHRTRVFVVSTVLKGIRRGEIGCPFHGFDAGVAPIRVHCQSDAGVSKAHVLICFWHGGL